MVDNTYTFYIIIIIIVILLLVLTSAFDAYGIRVNENYYKNEKLINKIILQTEI